MAAVFLSYCREDAAKAKALAGALRRAGHDVWWDRQISSGSEYAGEIEAALNEADAVIVLWSKSSVVSPWVRDEAEEGRDSRRLVPIALDSSRPPIGFRQYQTLDFSTWNGRGMPPAFETLLADLAKRSRAAGPADGVPRTAAGEQPKFRRKAFVIAAAAALALAIAVAAGLLLYPRNVAADEPTIAVLPFSDLSPERDKAYVAEGVAEAVLTILAREPGIDVIGRASAAQFQDRPGDLEAMRRSLGVTHIVEGSARTAGDLLRVTVRLVDASTGKEVWTEDYQRPMSNIFAVQDEIGRAVATSLKGSLAPEGGPSAIERTGVDAYTLYLAGRAKLRQRTEQSSREALEIARQVIRADPNYGGGYALFAESVSFLAEDAYGRIPLDTVTRIAEPYARRAVALAPNSAESHAALAAALWPTPSEAIGPLRRAVEADPSRGELRLWLGQLLNELGDNSEALENYRAAVELEPLLPQATRFLALALAASGKFGEAENVRRDFARRGGPDAWVAAIAADIALAQSDWSGAARLLHAAHRQRPDFRPWSNELARIYDWLGFEDSAEKLVAKEKPLFRLSVDSNSGEAMREVRNALGGPWTALDLEVASGIASDAREWSTLAALYDSVDGDSGEICRRPSSALRFATAMRELGRRAELAKLLECTDQMLTLHERGEYRSVGLPQGELAAARATFHALGGRGTEALTGIRRAVELGYRTPYGTGLGYLPAFDPFRSSREYRLLDDRLKRLIAAERAELLRRQRQSPAAIR